MNDSRDKEELEKRLEEIMEEMSNPEFWVDKERAQRTIQEMEDVKAEIEGVGKYDRGNAVLHIYSGAGGDDADDFARILFEMYEKFVAKKGWELFTLSKKESQIGGINSILVEIVGARAYGTLKSESGVHRLVRTSPFNSKGQRHTAFAMVEVLPLFEKKGEIEIKPEDVEIEFTRIGGPGGQNVNKRETAVRIVHKQTGISVIIATERSQVQNREKAMQILSARLWEKQEEDQRRLEKGLAVSETVEPEWGSQIRSYVLHPYKLVKDHRTDVEVRDVDSVLDGNIEPFLEPLSTN
ncbi:MAG: PCRF domain-containing protein [Candidatus Paceibacterota bacterium]